MKTRNRTAVGRLIGNSKLLGQLGIPFRGHQGSGRHEPQSDIKDIYIYIYIYQKKIFEVLPITVSFHGNPELAVHLKECAQSRQQNYRQY